MSQQTLKPDFISIHENGLKSSFFEWSCFDVPYKGTLLYSHTPGVVLNKADRFLPPLRALFNVNCDLFIKADIDDFFYSNWLKNQVKEIKKNKVEWLINCRNSVCLIKETQHDLEVHDSVKNNPPDILYWPDVDFGRINPIGGMSDNAIFTRRVAKEYIKALEEDPKESDDLTLLKVISRFKGKIINGKVESCYISHGKNVSTSVWQTYIPEF